MQVRVEDTRGVGEGGEGGEGRGGEGRGGGREEEDGGMEGEMRKGGFWVDTLEFSEADLPIIPIRTLNSRKPLFRVQAFGFGGILLRTLSPKTLTP